MTADSLSNKASAIKGDNYDSKTIRNRATIAGATVGGMFGLYYGYTRKKGLLVCTGAGVIMGAILSRLLMPKP